MKLNRVSSTARYRYSHSDALTHTRSVYLEWNVLKGKSDETLSRRQRCLTVYIATTHCCRLFNAKNALLLFAGSVKRGLGWVFWLLHYFRLIWIDVIFTPNPFCRLTIYFFTLPSHSHHIFSLNSFLCLNSTPLLSSFSLLLLHLLLRSGCTTQT